ncbi:GAF domain-containing protein [Arthrobacter sp. SA17]
MAIDTSVAERLQDLVIDSPDVSSFLAELCELSAASLSESMGLEVTCAITLQRRHRTSTAGWSSEASRACDEIQHNFGEGPCLHAMNTGTTVLVRDTRTDMRWPEYGSAISAIGQFSVLGVPLALDEAPLPLSMFLRLCPMPSTPRPSASLKPLPVMPKNR